MPPRKRGKASKTFEVDSSDEDGGGSFWIASSLKGITVKGVSFPFNGEFKYADNPIEFLTLMLKNRPSEIEMTTVKPFNVTQGVTVGG